MDRDKNNNVKTLTQHLNDLCDNDTAFIIDFVALFKKNAIEAMSHINQDNPKKSVNEIQLIAHKLKSNFLLFEFMEASALASDLENTQTHEEMTPIIKRINVLFLNILDELSRVNLAFDG